MRLEEGKETLLNIKPVLDVEMRARVSIHEGLPSDFDPWKLIDLITLEVGVPKQLMLFKYLLMFTLSRNRRGVKMMRDYTIVLN